MSNFDKHFLAFFPTHIHVRFGPIQSLQSIRKIINFWYIFGWKWWVISFRDYLGLSDACSYDVDDVIGRAHRFGFQNFCSPGTHTICFYGELTKIILQLSSNTLFICSTEMTLTQAIRKQVAFPRALYKNSKIGKTFYTKKNTHNIKLMPSAINILLDFFWISLHFKHNCNLTSLRHYHGGYFLWQICDFFNENWEKWRLFVTGKGAEIRPLRKGRKSRSHM